MNISTMCVIHHMQVMMNRLFSGTSSQEGGTLFQLRNLINRRNVNHVTQGKVNEIEDFLSW